MVDLDSMCRRFLMGEGKTNPTVRGYAESILNIIEMVRPRSQRESRQLSIAKKHLREIVKLNKKLEEKVTILEEKISILEEGK